MKKKDNKYHDDLPEEDLALKQQLEMYVERAEDNDPGLQRVALESMRQEIQSSTSSMTSVPKPLKFLRPHYGTLKAYYETMQDPELQIFLADILSVLALTMSAEDERDSLKYRLLGSEGDIGSWGHEYIRNLAGEIGHEYAQRLEEDQCTEDLSNLVDEIVAFHKEHNAEPEAVDLLMEVEELDLLRPYVNKSNYKRTCHYLTGVAKYLASPDNLLVLDIAFRIYLSQKEIARALQIAVYLNKLKYVRDIFERCDDLQITYVRYIFEQCDDLQQKKQFCFIIGRQCVNFELDDNMVLDDNDREQLQDIINNAKLSEGFLTLARDIKVMEAKSPEDIYKTHLLDGGAIGRASANVESAKQNLAATFVNAFVNAGFGQDTLMTGIPETSSSGSSGNWIFKNKEHGKTSAVASLGMILLWDIDDGLAQIGKYFHSNDCHVIAGALLGTGIFNCGIKHDTDPALCLLGDYVDKEELDIRIGAIMGLGIAYANTRNEQIRCKLTNILHDTNATLDVIAFTSISLGMVFVGSSNEEVSEAITYALMNLNESDLGEPLAKLLPLGLGLLYLGKQESVEATTEVSMTFNEKIRKHCDMTLLSCAYAGTGDVLKVQTLLGECAQHLDKGETHQGPAVIGIAMVAMAEEHGVEMAIRCMDHLFKYGEPTIRRAVPLALGLLCVSNPEVKVMDTLSRLSHDSELDVAMAAIISLGLIGAGTNNARLAGMLRNLSTYYYKDASTLFCVRIAQGLVYLGKGLLTLNPYYSDRFLLSPMALAGIVTMLHCCLNLKSIILGKYHYVLYYLVLAVQPKMLMTVDENLKFLSVPVRVGKAVDVVGQAGRPKTITGFQAFSTPVLLSAGERAELATDKYIPLSPILEGFVILKENPDYMDDK